MRLNAPVFLLGWIMFISWKTTVGYHASTCNLRRGIDKCKFPFTLPDTGKHILH